MSGAGGVDAQIPLAAGRIGQGGGNTLAAPGALMDTLTKIQQMQLFPGQLQRQQQEIQQGDIGIQKGHLDLTNSQNAAAYGHLTPLLQNPDPQLKDVTNAYGVAAGPSGLNVDRQVADAVKTFPVGGTAEERRAWVTARVSQSGISPENRVLLNTPAAGPDINTGQQIVPTTRGALLGATPNQVQMLGGRPGAPIPVVPSVSDLATPYHYTGSDGREVNTTKGQYAIDTGVNPASLGFTAGASVPPPPGKGSAPGAVPPPRKNMSGPAPGTVEAGRKTGEASADVFHQISTAGDAARGQDALLSTMQAEAQNFRPGPGADMAMTVKRTIMGIGAQFGVAFGVDPAKLAAQESVDKIANQLADAQGAGSDARLHVNQGANPSAHNTPAGLDLIIRQLRGNTDYLKARQQLAAAYPDKADSQGFLANVVGNLDPRVFQYSRLTPEQKGDYYKGISDKETFRKSYEYAEKSKLIGQPGGQ